VLPLFILCPNGREGVGQNRDKYVPRPSATKPLHLSMFEFLGQLMGLAIRTTELLNLDLPSIVWKSLVNDEITESDVLGIDTLSFKIIENIKQIERQMRGAPKDATTDLSGAAAADEEKKTVLLTSLFHLCCL